MSTDPWQLLGTARTVLAVHAHPDDESLSTGALLAALAADGTRVVLVTATRGEEGEIVAEDLAHLSTDESPNFVSGLLTRISQMKATVV